MRYINPKTDFAFKKIFGSTGGQGILRSCLHAVLYNAANGGSVSRSIIFKRNGLSERFLGVLCHG